MNLREKEIITLVQNYAKELGDENMRYLDAEFGRSKGAFKAFANERIERIQQLVADLP